MAAPTTGLNVPISITRPTTPVNKDVRLSSQSNLTLARFLLLGVGSMGGRKKGEALGASPFFL
jgi:hypothetical protein